MTRRFRTHVLAAVAVCAVLAAFALVEAGVASADWSYKPVGAATCPDVDAVVQPPGTPGYIMSRVRAERAVVCLVNAERTARGIAPLKRYIGVRIGGRVVVPGLERAASQHAFEAVARPWWGTKDAQGHDRSAHDNPYTGSTMDSRIRASGYCRLVSFPHNENAYVGWGAFYGTPRAAVSWWMGSDGHRATLLSPQYRDTGIAVVYGSADPAAGSITPAATFVQTFGACG